MFKTLDLKSLSIGVLITLVAVTFMLIATSSPAPSQWEYKTLLLVGQSQFHAATLDGLGKDGWEVVGFANSPGGRNENEVSRYVLKRAKAYSKKPRWIFW